MPKLEQFFHLSLHLIAFLRIVLNAVFAVVFPFVVICGLFVFSTWGPFAFYSGRVRAERFSSFFHRPELISLALNPSPSVSQFCLCCLDKFDRIAISNFSVLCSVITADGSGFQTLNRPSTSRARIQSSQNLLAFPSSFCFRSIHISSSDNSF